ncbi:ubiquitin-associated protein 1 [Nasonia vitripennis]|uniref:Ubiquitin-associated protein 1 n=1 Tax=Nasonia vitripennis TaxID=7425 RepID=A0A7M7Q4S2_NASVI|nr:ubiquitin-associated protein 1 [Nasonia vitripennis]
MSRASNSTQCEPVATYMDGVQVKIAEAYKPPPKVLPPAAFYNKLPDVSKCSYDFSLEKSVLEKMKEWRKVRLSYSEARHVRLEEKRKREAEKSPAPSSPSPDTATLPVKVAPAPEATILTPQPLSFPANGVQNHVKLNGLDDYSYFDNDTSSPFDNMELKTINEMEELAQVLQATTSQWAPPSSNLEGMMNDLAMEQNVDKVQEEEKVNEYKENEEPVPNKHIDARQRMVSLIVQELQKELERPNNENRQPWPDLESPVTETSPETCTENSSTVNKKELARILADLSSEDQELAKRLSDMGFPLSRVTRAIRDLEGQDNKKIVEYLLAIQSLEDFGMSEEAAVKALALTQYDQDKAKVYYESLCTLRGLGFPEDKASMALLKCNIDQDSALDLLTA